MPGACGRRQGPTGVGGAEGRRRERGRPRDPPVLAGGWRRRPARFAAPSGCELDRLRVTLALLRGFGSAGLTWPGGSARRPPPPPPLPGLPSFSAKEGFPPRLVCGEKFSSVLFCCYCAVPVTLSILNAFLQVFSGFSTT